MINKLKELFTRRSIEDDYAYQEWLEDMYERGALDVDYSTHTIPLKRRWNKFKPVRKISSMHR